MGGNEILFEARTPLGFTVRVTAGLLDNHYHHQTSRDGRMRSSSEGGLGNAKGNSA
jgi:hypothetical protein